MLDPIVTSISGYSSIFINFDILKRYDYGNKNEYSLIILLLENDSLIKISQLGRQYDLMAYHHFLIASKNSTLNDKITNFAVTSKINNIGLILFNQNGTYKLSRFVRQNFVFLPGEHNNCSIYDRLFATSNDLKGIDNYVYIKLDPPHGIILKGRNKEGKQVHTIGGREAYLASLIERKINIPFKLIAYSQSAEHKEGTLPYIFVHEFHEKIYEDDNHMSRQSDNTQILKKYEPKYY